MRKLYRRLKLEARDLIELVLVPGLAAILPWPLCYRLFKRLSRWRLLYREACDQEYPYARQRGWFNDLEAWRAARRLVMLVDHADYYLCRFRTTTWMRRHMDVDGSWPAPGKAAILCSFHWGCGMWALWHLGAAGLHPHPLVATLRRDMFPGRWVRYQYFRLRNNAVRDALGQEPLDTAASLRPALEALRADGQLIALLDVPPGQVSTSQEIDFLGARARMPRGVLRIAADRGLPVTLYVNGFRRADGRRFLRVETLEVESDLPALMQTVFTRLEALIREDPAMWHFWEVAELFFQVQPEAPSPI
jgi:lauroyl/myristoyl acyltransferase